jgi:hypothetical protein
MICWELMGTLILHINNQAELYLKRILNSKFESFTNVKDQQKIAYNNTGYVNWIETLTQLAFKDNLSVFYKNSFSTTGTLFEKILLHTWSLIRYIKRVRKQIGWKHQRWVQTITSMNKAMSLLIQSSIQNNLSFKRVYPNNASIICWLS